MSESPPDKAGDSEKAPQTSAPVADAVTAAPEGKGAFLARFRAKKKTEEPSDEPKSKSDDAPPPVPPVSLGALLFRFATKKEIFLNVIGLIAAVGTGAAQPLMTLIFGKLANSFIAFGNVLERIKAGDASAVALLPEAIAAFRRDAAANASYLVYTGIGTFACTYVFMHTWIYTGEMISKRIRERYLQAVLRQDIAFFDGLGAGGVTTRIQNDTHLVQLGVSEKIPLSVNFISSFITGFILAYIRSWRLALALTSIFPWLLGTSAFMMKFMGKWTTASLNHVSDGGTIAEEVISTVRTAQAFGTQNTLALKFDEHVTKAGHADLSAAIYQGMGVGTMFFVVYASYSLNFYFGTILINKGLADAGIVINVGLAILIGSLSLAMLAPDMQAIINGQAAAAKLFETIDRVPDIDSADPGGLKKPEGLVGDIVLENVNFYYPSRPTVQVLQDFSITFAAGKTAALVGASGSGKSTIVSLIERFYDPREGSVKVDGINVKDFNLKWLRSQIGLVMQEPTLFSTTIKQNVAHGLINTHWEHASEEHKFSLIKEACIKANADAFISQLPQGYDTVVGERGILLSGGQKQRVAIARAIVSDPRILLLDEATSALDTQSEGVVQDALDKASAGRTTITIAHRLSTIKDADQIFVMGQGTVIEQGTHDELLRDEDGAYTRLVRAQNLRDGNSGVCDDASGTTEQDRTLEPGLDDRRIGRKDTFNSETFGKALITRPPEEKAQHSFVPLFRRMGALNREALPDYLLGGFFAILSGLTFPAFAIVWAKSLEGFSAADNNSRRRAGNRNAMWLFIIALISSSAIAAQSYVLTKAAANLTRKLRSLSFRAVLRQDIKFFDKSENSTGALTSRINTNPTKIGGLAGISLGAIIQGIATLIVGYIIGLIFAWKVAIIGIVCTPIVGAAGFIHLWVIIMKDEENKKAHEDSAQLACEAAGSIHTVAALTREDDCLDLYHKSLESPLKYARRSAIRSAALYGLTMSTTFWVIALVFWYGSRLVASGEYTPTRFFIGLMGVTFGAMQAGNAFAFVPDISSARSAASDVISLLDSVPEIDAESVQGKSLEPESVTGRMRIEDVHFRYPSRPEIPVLRGLSLKVERGMFIALAGASGSGKSTVIQILERFYDPWSGRIYLDEYAIPDLNVQEYRKQLALVSQEPTLYAGSVHFNVLLGAAKPIEQVTQEEIEAACRDANILDFIRELPDGFDTNVGSKGTQLSGGQKQRIAIARALLRNPKVLLLDEATSALDSSAEKVVQEALDQAAKGRTTIAIAHRLSTIQNADCIYFIKDGRISESGTHDQLSSRRGDYYAYCQLQALHG